MSERDRWVPTMSISNTAPPRICEMCDREIYGVFYVCQERGRDPMILCERCRP
jgi:hypothetical protein